MFEVWDHYVSPSCNIFHTQCAGGKNQNLWHFIFLPLSQYNEKLIFCLFVFLFLNALFAFLRAAVQFPCRCCFPAHSAITPRWKTAIHVREWLPASPSPTTLMSTCGPLLNWAKLIPATEMSFTLAPVLKHTAEPLRGSRGVMGLAWVRETS